MNRPAEHNAHFLDITREVCPMTFVKTKLRLEALGSGEMLEVRFMGAEPLANLPRAAAEIGCRVVSLTSEDEASAPQGVHRLLLQKP